MKSLLTKKWLQSVNLFLGEQISCKISSNFDNQNSKKILQWINMKVNSYNFWQVFMQISNLSIWGFDVSPFNYILSFFSDQKFSMTDFFEHETKIKTYYLRFSHLLHTVPKFNNQNLLFLRLTVIPGSLAWPGSQCVDPVELVGGMGATFQPK